MEITLFILDLLVHPDFREADNRDIAMWVCFVFKCYDDVDNLVEWVRELRNGF